MKKSSSVFLFGCWIAIQPALFAAADPQPGKLTLWYDSPAKKVAVNEGLPVGNSRVGGLIFGVPERERIVLNEDSLWTGDDNPTGDYAKMGAYQQLADLFIDLPDHAKPENYRRDLDLSQALAHVRYEVGGVTYHREIFASHPAEALVVRLTADKPGRYTGTLSLADSHNASTVAGSNRLTASGTLANGLHYESQLVAMPEGGGVSVSGDKLSFKGCNALTLVFAAGTDYAMDFNAHYRGELPHARITRQVDAAAARPYEVLKTEHVQDFQSLFNRVALNLGESTPEQRALPTDQRKAEASKTGDPELEGLLFQYGRYLLISCSRPGGLPANLQGLWNDSNNPAWSCDYHANINVQMNYWLAEPVNLSECHRPFFNLVTSQLPAWRTATEQSPAFKTNTGAPTSRGFAIRTSHNIYGGLGWKWDKTANAWYCLHFWEHYVFTGDKEYLKTVAYPIMQETVEFWEDHLKTLPDGRLVVPDGWSPEHGPTEDGVNYSQEIVWDLFNNYTEAATALGVDSVYRDKVAAMRDKLTAPKVGSWGQLLEWMDEKKDKVLDTPNDHHRHTSHLFGVFPGRQLSVAKTPELAKAAKVSLDARGNTGDVREWSNAWRTALYARLHDSAGAHTQVLEFFKRTCLNLFGNHPPMQMDGNFGMSAGIAEILLQSHEDGINLLPALPAEWKTGSVKGLRARGGYEVDLRWKEGALAEATVHNISGGPCTVRYGAKTAQLTLTPGQTVTLGPDLKR